MLPNDNHEVLQEMNIMGGCIAFCHGFSRSEEVVEKCPRNMLACWAGAGRVDWFCVFLVGLFGDVDLAVCGKDRSVACVLGGVA